MMITLSNYFYYKEEIKNILIIVTHDSTKELLLNMCKNMKLEKIYIASNTKRKVAQLRKYLESSARLKPFCLPQIISISYVKTICLDDVTDNIDVVLFDSSAEKSAILSTRALKPAYLVGRLWRDYVPYFILWEEFRAVSQHIHLECIGTNDKIDIVDWNKNPHNDTELSVILPVYNVARYLDKCIATLIAWEAPYVEFLFINDGSPDDSKEIILEYQKKDSRIKLIDKPNGGCASARKKGVEVAKGKYIGFVDPDDFIDEEMFKKLFSRALAGSYDICYAGYNAFYENSGKIERIEDALYPPYSNGTTDRLEIEKLIIYCRVAIWRSIYKAQFLKQNHIEFQENLRRFDDLPFKIETFAKAKSVVAIPEFLYYYRLERPGQDVACDDQRLYVHFDIFKYLDKVIGSLKNQKLFDFLQLAKVQTHCFTLTKIQKSCLKHYCQQAREDFKTNHATVIRTSLLIMKYFGKDNLLAYLSIMSNQYRLYTKYLEFKGVRNKKRN